MRTSTGLAAVFAALAVVLATTDPVGLAAGRAVLGAGTPDQWGHIWGYAWTADALAHGQLPFADAPLLHPVGQRWWIIDLSVAVLLTPITWLLGPVAAFHLACVAPVAAGVVGGSWWLERRGVPLHLALGAAVVASTGPFVRGALVSGVPEALVVLWLPLFAVLVERALEGGRRTLAAAALLGAFVVLNGAYGPLLGGLVGAVVALTTRGGRPWGPHLGRAALVAAPAGLLTLAVRGALAASAHPALHGATPVGGAFGPQPPYWPLQQVGGFDLASLVTPAALLPLDAAPPSAHRHVVYLGVLALLGAGVAAARQPVARLLVALAVVCLALAAGSPLTVWGQPVVSWPPGLALLELGARNPYRFVGLAWLAVVAAAALAPLRPRAVGALLCLILVDGALNAPLPLRLPTTPNPAGPIEAALATDPAPGAVLDLPFDHEGTRARGPDPQRTFALQAHHGRPVASGLYQPAPIARADRTLSKLDRAIIRARSGDRPAAPPPQPSGSACEGLARTLRAEGFGFVVLDNAVMPELLAEPAHRAVEACFGPAALQDGARSLWRLNTR